MKYQLQRCALSATTVAWLLLCVLSVVSVVLAAQSHTGLARMGLTLLVALLAWAKARVLLRRYLEVQRAGPVFVRLLQGFAVLAPLGLAASALREYLLL
ncbi:hypothetical protein RQP54_05795 [Curvibacter sp. APW13]|uniref:hypothetical protein n=1 Tax=Curvibacter sp. APW13 TaxID=3077236 RepID=UPI0028DEA939|nr:hypothetical protein [Curvibacter sp. APW13]MDT8990374.1 hypothetical protein [Curvibacter sp. APW13]